MNDHQHEIADANVERLLGTYKPDQLDEAFVLQVEAELCAAAREQASQNSARAATPDPLARTRRRLGWAMGLAASLAACFLVYYGRTHRGAPLPSSDVQPGEITKAIDEIRPVSIGNGQFSALGLAARARPQAPAVKPVDIGTTLTTGANERRRVVLTDGSVLYLNQNSEARYSAERQVVLQRGEIFVEVTPRDPAKTVGGLPGATFVVKASGREVAALGTRFGVQAETQGTGVIVTQGKVKVSGLDEEIAAGQQLSPGSEKVTAAPRASHVLDWTRELMAAAESPLVPGSKHAGGALVALDPFGQEVTLSLRKYHIDVHIEDGFARTTIDQTYFNNNHWRMEGTFYFPLPPDASLSRLAMYVEDGKDCKLMEGGMAERDHARTVYETILHQRRDPALLEWVDGSTFKMRVFPLEGRKEKRIILSYTQRIPSLYGASRYRFPAGHNMELVKDWSFEARVKHAAELRVTSDSHQGMQIKPKAADMVLTTSARNVKPDKDVTVEIYDSDGAKNQDTAHYSSFVHENQHYLMLRYRPELAEQPRRERRDWVILFEAAANRDPLLARTQIDVIKNLLENAEHDDTFSLLTANTRVRIFDKQTRAVNQKNIDEAVKFLETSHLIGAMDLNQALTAIQPFLARAKNPYLLHVGAGIAAMGERKEDVLAKKIPDGARYVGIGIGKRWSRAFMKTAADRTGGFFTQINPDEPLAWRTFELLATLNTPRLMDLRVVDAEEKVTFLSETAALAQGEEVVALARNQGPLPSKVIVSGKLNGKNFVKTLDVQGVVPGAGYLPRTWAKLEIDRLLADGAEKNKKAVTELSMAMYVMSPFTSLLVLETEADYKTFKVDKGRKDHWAMYPCPDRIPLVFEPDPNQQAWMGPWNNPVQANKAKKNAQEVLGSILVRTPPTFIALPNRPQQQPQILTAQQWFNGAFAMPLNVRLGDIDPAGIDPDVDITFNTGRIANISVPGTINPNDTIEFLSDLSAVTSMPSMGGSMSSMGGRGPGFGLMGGAGLGRELPAGTGPMVEGRLGFGKGQGIQFAPMFAAPAGESIAAGLTELGFRRSTFTTGTWSGLNLPALDPQDRAESAMMLTRTEEEGAFKRVQEGWLHSMTMRLMHGWGQRNLIYQKPQFVAHQQLFGDLTIYAPGLHTSMADIQTALESEATAEKQTPIGLIDPAARKLIDKARGQGWQSVTIPAQGKTPAFKVTYSGDGRFTYDRVLSSGMREVVLCDGKTLWSLYPEIGLAARRSYSRFHQDTLADLVPWFLSSAEELARGADLKLVRPNRVAMVSRAPASKDAAGKTLPTREVHLIFGDGGRLLERLIVEMPSKKVLGRQTFDAEGVVKLHGEDSKVRSERSLSLVKAEAPDLKADTKDLLVMEFPLRTVGHVQGQGGWDGTFVNMDTAKAEQFFIADALQNNGWRALQNFGERFHSKGDRRLGFYVLLNASGIHIPPEQVYVWHGKKVTFDPKKENPKNALALYVAHHQETVRTGTMPLLDKLPGPQDGFIQRLGEFRDLWSTWNSDRATRDGDKKFAEHRARALKFVQETGSAMFAWGLLDAMQRLGRPADAAFHKAIAEAHKEVGDQLGLTYSARYEYARSLQAAGKNKEALQAFKDLYLEVFKTGALPTLDTAIRDTFNQSAKEGEQPFGQFMRKIHGDLLKDDRPHSALLIAWQLHQLGDTALADELFTTTMNKAPAKDKSFIILTGMEYLWQTGQLARADVLLQKILADPKVAERAAVWRLSAVMAQRRGLLARSVAALEKAMDLEYRSLPDVINLQTVRTDYGGLLAHYQQLATALTLLESEAPKDFLAKVVRAADRWRSLDPGNEQVCQQAAQILQALGAKELAWDYLTTPIGMKPNESGPWVGLAHTLQQEAEFELADRAYALAFEVEPTNAEILSSRAANLMAMGKIDQARGIYRQIADGTWQPRFQWLQQQARWHLTNQ